MSDETASAPPLSSAADLAAELAQGAATPADVIGRCRARIEAREADVMAWQALDWDFVERQVEALAQRPADARGPLFGLPVGIKDIYDTADLATGYGSVIYEGHRPAADAAAVARLRAAGAVVLGKTVSTEFAYWQAGKTRNPLDPARSPGGSSSGSAAAVADGMVALAIGSQTAASTVRPAAYCGIVGFKPTLGLASLAGVKALAASLDTVGVFARDVAGAGLIASVLTARPALSRPADLPSPPSLAVAMAPEWQGVAPAARARFDATVESLAALGCEVRTFEAPPAFAGLAAAQTAIMAHEAARELAYERHHHADRLSRPLMDLLTQGEGIAPAQYDDACRQRDDALGSLDALFGDADALLAPSALGEAPLLADGTGDPAMSRAWTLIGLPSISLPAGTGENDLPLGLQVAGRPREDERLLAVAGWLERRLAPGGK